MIHYVAPRHGLGIFISELLPLQNLSSTHFCLLFVPAIKIFAKILQRVSKIELLLIEQMANSLTTVLSEADIHIG